MFYSLEFYADISELDVRMETVEGRVSDHDARLSTIDTSIEGNIIIFVVAIKWKFIIVVVLKNC